MTGADGKTGVALIGLGMVAATYVDALSRLSDKVKVCGVHARSPDGRAEFIRTHGDALGPDCRSYGSIDEIAADPDIAFVIVATPPNARRDIVSTLAGAGKAILMEKPVERTVAAAEELCRICEDAGVPLGITLQHRARPSALDLRNLLAENNFGPLHACEISIPWWRPQSYYDDPGRGTYSRDGGGVLISQAIHTLDLALSFTGPAEEVTALTATTGLHQMESEDFVSAGLTFAGGAVGTLYATTACYPGNPEFIRLHFGNVTAHLESNLLLLAWHDGREEKIGAATASGAGADPMAFTSDWHMAIVQNFAECLGTGQPPMVPGRDALHVHRLIEALEKSGREGKRVRVNT